MKSALVALVPLGRGSRPTGVSERLFPIAPTRHCPPQGCVAVSEEGCWGGNPLQVLIRGRVDKRDTEFVGDKPVGLLQMMRTVAQNDREQFEDGHFTAIVGRDHPVKGGGI